MNRLNELFRLFWRHSPRPNVISSDVAVKKLIDGGTVFAMRFVVRVL